MLSRISGGQTPPPLSPPPPLPANFLELYEFFDDYDSIEEDSEHAVLGGQFRDGADQEVEEEEAAQVAFNTMQQRRPRRRRRTTTTSMDGVTKGLTQRSRGPSSHLMSR
jgi:hypothetical protein